MRSPGRGPLSSPPLVVPDTAVRFTPSPVKKATHEKRCSRFSRSRPIIAAKRPSFLKLSFFQTTFVMQFIVDATNTLSIHEAVLTT